ncbi:MAG: cyclic nucleotide-binding domain-containing protein [Acidimicrobiia bacterium]
MVKSKDASDLLAAVDLFEELTPSELKQVSEIAKPLEFVTDEAVTEEGTPGGRFHLIESGTAKVVTGGRTVATLGPGDYFGELSLIDGDPRSASVVAIEPLRTWSIAEWNFRPLLKTQGTIAYKLLVMLCRRLRAAESTHSA